MNTSTKETSVEEIEAAIGDANSPVGIDAKKTHVIIIQKLIAIEERLKRLEEQ